MKMDITQEEKDFIQERHLLAMDRIRRMAEENTVKEPFRDYFKKVAEFMILVDTTAQTVEAGRLKEMTMQELQALNHALYEDIIGENYETSYTNPSYACKLLGAKHGKLLSFLFTELRGMIVYAFERQQEERTIYLELLIEVYNNYEEDGEFLYKDAKKAIYDFLHDNCPIFTRNRLVEFTDPEYGVGKDIVMNADLSDMKYLYYSGEYISENELKIAAFLNSLPEEQIQAMADTFTEGYRRGFLSARLDITSKSTVNLRYPLGFERVARYTIHNFRKLGLESIVYRAAHHVLNKRQHLKIGYHGTSPNKQFDYDHRFDIALFMDKGMNERRLECRRTIFETLREKTVRHAGPSLIEVFGEELFVPKDKKEALKLDKRQQKLYTEFYNRDARMQKDYYKLDETSFTIIAYPIPEIGDRFEEIFAETIRVNNLDSKRYSEIQQTIIDALDQGEYVHILGAGDNHTDMMVKLHPLKDAAKETIFENCVADVNIPVGEIFTSPVLKGTAGVLHVPQVYLNGLEYKELELIFEDGKVADYTCGLYKDEGKNKAFIKENLLYNHEFLPLGEFAIGTNTAAYMMGKKYEIAAKLPILIAEKTGPHFAIGDTCYSMSEENKTYNPDGKEIVAKENDFSAMRKEDFAKAYFNCHTDITLPYDEIGEIAAVRRDGSRISIIKDARFVLPGTEELNLAFDEKDIY